MVLALSMSFGTALVQAAGSEATNSGEASRVTQLDAFRLDDELVAIVLDHVNHVLAETPPPLRGFLSVRHSAANMNNTILIHMS